MDSVDCGWGGCLLWSRFPSAELVDQVDDEGFEGFMRATSLALLTLRAQPGMGGSGVG